MFFSFHVFVSTNRHACSVAPSHFALSILRAAEGLAVKLGDQVRGSGVDVELILHGAAHHVPDLDLHCATQLQGKQRVITVITLEGKTTNRDTFKWLKQRYGLLNLLFEPFFQVSVCEELFVDDRINQAYAFSMY